MAAANVPWALCAATIFAAWPSDAGRRVLGAGRHAVGLGTAAASQPLASPRCTSLRRPDWQRWPGWRPNAAGTPCTGVGILAVAAFLGTQLDRGSDEYVCRGSRAHRRAHRRPKTASARGNATRESGTDRRSLPVLLRRADPNPGRDAKPDADWVYFCVGNGPQRRPCGDSLTKRWPGCRCIRIGRRKSRNT